MVPGATRKGGTCKAACTVSAGKPTNAVDFEDRGHGFDRQRLRARRGEGQVEQGPEPGLIGGRAEGQGFGAEAVQLLAQAIAEARSSSRRSSSRREISRSSTIKGSSRCTRRKAGRSVRSESREDEGVAAVVLGARHGMAVAEAVQLLGVEGEDVQAAFEQGVDDGAAGTSMATATRPGSSGLRATSSVAKAVRPALVWGTVCSVRLPSRSTIQI